MFLSIVIVAVIAFGYLLWFDTHCELNDLRKKIDQAITDIEKVMPKATHSVKTEVLSILRRLKC